MYNTKEKRSFLLRTASDVSRVAHGAPTPVLRLSCTLGFAGCLVYCGSPLAALPTVMVALDTSVANVALPHIAGSLSASADETTWVLTGYLVANAIVLPISGWIAQVLGRRRFLIISMIAFTISSSLHFTPYDPAFRESFHRLTELFSTQCDPVTATRKAYRSAYDILLGQSTLFAFVDNFRFLGFLFPGMIDL